MKNSWNSSTIRMMRGNVVFVAVSEPREVVAPGRAEAVTAVAEFGVEPLQHAQAEFALALDGDHAGVRQAVRRVRS